MKQIAFRLNDNTGKTEAYLVEHKGLQEDGSVITIDERVLQEAHKAGITKSRYFGRGIDTVFYEFESLTIVSIKGNSAILLDQCLIDNEPIGLTFNKAKKSISFKTKGGKKGRKIPRVSIKKVRHTDNTKEKNIVFSENYPTSLPGVLWSIKTHKITGLNLAKDEIYDIVDMDVHHIYAPWDNRLASTITLTEKEHKEYHSVNGKQKHDVYVKITSLNELEAFIEFVTKL